MPGPAPLSRPALPPSRACLMAAPRPPHPDRRPNESPGRRSSSRGGERWGTGRAACLALALAIAASLGSLAPAPARAQGAPEILETFDSFVLANAAAYRCLRPYEDALNRFLTNYQNVAVSAHMKLTKLWPDRSNAEIKQMMKERSRTLTDQLHWRLEQEGCQGPTITELLHLFQYHSQNESPPLPPGSGGREQPKPGPGLSPYR